MKKAALLMMAGLIFVVSSAFAEMKVGVIDLNKVLANDPQVKTFQAQLKKEFDPRSKELATAQKNLQAEVEKFNKDSEKLKGDSLKQAQNKLMAMQKKFQEQRDKFQRDVMTAQNQSMQTVLKKVQEKVSKIAIEQKFDLILTKISTAYYDPKLEITNQVIDSFKEKK